ncbi:MAG: acetyl-CoA carboxylase biotin carboxyl carrier protein subunit [candidate division Zixibacteria bacterium]|nr:acetyl-CoA carboxylase biotin carboxyl carrier protein subunit [candidate division Zixibacteria bacterium]
MIYEFVHNGELKTVDLKDNRIATFPDVNKAVEIDCSPDGRFYLHNGDARSEVHAVVSGDTIFVDINSVLYEFTIPSQDGGKGTSGGGDMADPSKVYAPMPGKVVKVIAVEGDEVEAKAQLIIVEAMKMEHICIAKAKGKVTAVNFKEGDQVDTETPLIELELAE